MPRLEIQPEFWKGRRILLSGHTGFKGCWMAVMLNRLGANVYGIALNSDGEPNLKEILFPWDNLSFITCDIRNKQALNSAIQEADPEIVIHMAAQALVMKGYSDPVGTIETNVMGTVNLLESLCSIKRLLSVLIITSDKVYENKEAGLDFAETDALGGHDPYSASKTATEILTASYRDSFYCKRKIPVMTARAGNIIGGGDWAEDRLIPDLWRAFETKNLVLLRNPNSVRPWQYILEPLFGYLLYIQHSLSGASSFPNALNFGPPRKAIRTTRQIAELFSNTLNTGELWILADSIEQQYEAKFLSINSSLSLATLGWKTALSVEEAVRWTGNWYNAYHESRNMRSFTENQIDAYIELVESTASYINTSH